MPNFEGHDSALSAAIDRELRASRTVRVFVGDADCRLRALADDFAERVGRAAVREAQDRGGTVVDIVDVDKAYDEVVAACSKSDPRGSRKVFWASAFHVSAGVFAGVVVDPLCTWPVPHPVWWTCAAIVSAGLTIGSALLARR